MTCRVVSCRDETRRASEEEEEECACGTSLLTHLPSGATPHLICWSTSLPTFHVALNLAPTPCLCAAKNMSYMSHGLTQMGFEISRNFSNLVWAHSKKAQYFNNPPPDLKFPFRDLPNLTTCLYTSVSAETVKLNFRLEP
jgi:hypothetical protein